MSFLSESPAVLFLRPNDLFVFSRSGQRQIVFPATVVKNQEVADKKLFEKLLKDFFVHLPKQNGVLFLSHGVVFDRAVKVEAQTTAEEELKKFLDSVPLAATHIATKAIETPQRDFFFASNSDIYETIIAIATQYGWQIKYVVPLSLFDDLLKGQQVSYAFFLRVLRNKKLLDKGNFLEGEAKEEKTPRGQYLMLGASLVFLLGAVAFAGINFHFFPFFSQTQPKRTAVVEPTKVPVVTDTPTPVSSEEATLKKEDLKIQVLNGSGIAGQASALKDHLGVLGYANVETGNAEGPVSNATIVIFSERVPQEIQDEILIELKKNFKSVDSQQIPAAEGFDVTITIGEVK